MKKYLKKTTMKKILTLAVLILTIITFKSQLYQNTTASATADAVDITGSGITTACGLNTQPAIKASVINVPINGIISDPSKVTIHMSLVAAWGGDVAVDLLTPDDQVITLIKRLGAGTNISCGSSVDFASTNTLSFNSTNTTNILTTTNPIPAGNYLPTGDATIYPLHKMVSMSTFLNAKSVNGNWKLYIYDYGVGDPVNINSWALQLDAGALLKTTDVGGIFGNIVSIKENPVKDNLLISINKKDFRNMKLDIFDGTGKLVKTQSVLKGLSDFTIDASYLAPGMYMLVPIVDGEKTQALKFIKK